MAYFDGYLGKFKAANYWPFMKWDIIELFALNLKIIRFKGSLHRFEYRNFCVNVYTCCISVVRPLIDVNLVFN